MEWRPSGRHSFLWLHSSVLLRRCSLFRLYSPVLLRCCSLFRLHSPVILRRPCAISQWSSPLRRAFLCSFRPYPILPSPSPIVIIRCSGWLRKVQLSFPPSPIVIIRCKGQLHMSLWLSLSLFRWFCRPLLLFRLFSLSFCRQATWFSCKLSVMNSHAQILRKLLMIVNTAISLPASVIMAYEPVVSATFVLVLTIAVVILPW